MKKILGIIAASFLVLTSCTEGNTAVVWDTAQPYESFWWDEYQTERLTRTLEFEFNEDAKNANLAPLVFEIKEKGENGYKSVDYIDVWQNGTPCPDHKITVTTADSEVEVAIAFKEGTPENREGYQLYLVNTVKGGIDNIDNELEIKGFTIPKKHITNPLKVMVIWIAIVILSILLAWILIVHLIMYPGTPFSRMTITYSDDSTKVIRMGHAHKLICTNTPIKRSWLKNLFGGCVKIEVNEFWERPVAITSGRRNRIRLSGLGDAFTVNDETVRKQPFTVINSQAQEVTIETT